MPKQKTHKATAKRISISGSGKILSQHAAGRHLLTNKSNRSNIRLTVNRADRKKIKRLVPGVK